MSKAEVDALCKLANDCLQLQQMKQAKELFDKAVAADIDSPDAHEGLASIAFLSGDFPNAVAHYIKLTLLKPMEARHYTNLGAVFNRTGEFEKAVDALRKAIQRDKRSAEAYYNLGIAQRKLKRWQMAISAYREAARLNPKMAEAFQNLGNVYIDTANLPMAIMNFKKALEIRPDFEKARIGLEKAEAASNSAKEAVNPFGRLVKAESYQVSNKTVDCRELTDAERYEDRHTVKHIADEIERLSKGCLEFLKLRLEPALIELQRTMAEGSNSQSALVDVAEEYYSASNQWTELRKAVKRKVLELRAHEELINAPEVKL
ncbi:tetratricopeptide repeat protein [Schlesneria paludicola]|uniref:tetratricopeptide repeat protein n=1 Tax=Schlesneria paludicola TaxID=360056 RepID=UPI00029A1FAA|nr:tetratricopeptide repeat protein [Schlesneria paludicola]